jgi:predicted dehydrogenase
MAEANFGFNCEWNPETRLLNPALGGGALLDAGIYPVSLSSMIFGGKKPEVTSQMYLGETGVDEEVSAVLSYNGRIATVSAAIRTAMVNDAYIYGTEGYIHLPNFIFSRDATLCVSGRDPYNYKPEFVSNGYNYEAEAVMNYIKEGKFESGIMGLDESLTIMQTLDTIREQGKLQYPGEEGDR